VVNRAGAAYRPLAMLLGAAAGVAAGSMFERGWRAVSGSDRVPRAIDQDSGWGEILLAAALHGAVFAVVKAAAERVSATGVQRMTGTWPT
jgi:hypothetical protein